MQSVTCEDFSCPLCAGYCSDDEYNESTNSMLREMGKGHQFVRYVTDVDGEANPIVVLFTDEQLIDIKRFCCRREGGTPLGIDTTHKHGNFQLTFTVYKDLSVVRNDYGKSQSHPICFGPAFIHYGTKSQTNILSSFLDILAVNLSAEEVKSLTIGSRQDPEIVTSVKRCLNDASHVFCTIQLKQKINKFMKEKAGYPLDDRKEISEAIFGFDGLTSSADNNTLKARVAALRILIGQKDAKVTKSDKPMRSYFDKELIPLLCTSVIKPYLQGKVPKHWTNNNAMSLRHLLKQWMDSEQVTPTIPRFIARFYRLVEFETSMRTDAILGRGSFRLDGRFSHHMIDIFKWMGLSKEEKGRRTMRFQRSRGRPQQSTISTSKATKPIPKSTPTVAVVKSAPSVAVVKSVSTVAVMKRTSTVTVVKSASSTIATTKRASTVTVEKRVSTLGVLKDTTTVPRSIQVKRKLTEQSGTPKRVRWCDVNNWEQ